MCDAVLAQRQNTLRDDKEAPADMRGGRVFFDSLEVDDPIFFRVVAKYPGDASTATKKQLREWGQKHHRHVYVMNRAQHTHTHTHTHTRALACIHTCTRVHPHQVGSWPRERQDRLGARGHRDRQGSRHTYRIAHTTQTGVNQHHPMPRPPGSQVNTYSTFSVHQVGNWVVREYPEATTPADAVPATMDTQMSLQNTMNNAIDEPVLAIRERLDNALRAGALASDDAHDTLAAVAAARANEEVSEELPDKVLERIVAEEVRLPPLPPSTPPIPPCPPPPPPPSLGA